MDRRMTPVQQQLAVPRRSPWVRTMDCFTFAVWRRCRLVADASHARRRKHTVIGSMLKPLAHLEPKSRSVVLSVRLIGASLHQIMTRKK